MIMSTISSAPVPRTVTGRSLARGLVASFRRWWVGYTTWRTQQAAIAQLWSMNDRALKDIGFTRSEIPRAVKGDGSDRAFSRYY
jgi:uncharacterized protein YjiS (DUF1127 family)